MKEKLLLIAPLFFGYYLDIVDEAERKGYDVTYLCDAPSNSNISKAIGRINNDLIKGKTERYFNNRVLPVIQENDFKIVLIVGGMTFSFTADMVKRIKNCLPRATFILYQWDSEINLPYSTKIHPYMDKLFSFDRYDCKRNSRYVFLPLFYNRKCESVQSYDEKHCEYDCSYIGTAHPQKYKDINEMAIKLRSVFPRQFVYHYMPSRLKYIYHKLKDKEYKKAKYKEFETKKLSVEQIMDVFSKSKCIMDAPQSGQTGLTIRTIECLGAKRKLITTNADIKNYDFYNEANILIFNKNINFGSAFFTNDFQDIPEAIYEKYSLRNWLNAMLGE